MTTVNKLKYFVENVFSRSKIDVMLYNVFIKVPPKQLKIINAAWLDEQLDDLIPFGVRRYIVPLKWWECRFKKHQLRLKDEYAKTQS